ncbi:hypothetical protein A5715_17495 [Mycolicibacter heraklionensis]|nr:hypothetical protein A5715_17495 [Mycolicibacter heraklionensis]
MESVACVDDRRRHMAVVAATIKVCRLCPGMNIVGETESAPGYGAVDSPLVLVGQSLCGKPCMDSQIPFTGGSGSLLDAALQRARIRKPDVFITNVVHCHPEGNLKSKELWINNCSPYLHLELKIVQPKVVVGLGDDARDALQNFYARVPEEVVHPFRATRTAVPSREVPAVLFTKHPSWIQRQKPERREQYVDDLASVIKWAFRRRR